MHAMALGQARVRHGRRLVHAPPSGPSMRSMSALSCASSENRASERNRRPPLEEHVVRAVHHDLGDRIVGEKPFERAESQQPASTSSSASRCRSSRGTVDHATSSNTWRHALFSSLRARFGFAAIMTAMSSADTSVRTSPSTLRGRTKALGALPKPPLRPPRAPGPSKTWLPLPAPTRPPGPPTCLVAEGAILPDDRLAASSGASSPAASGSTSRKAARRSRIKGCARPPARKARPPQAALHVAARRRQARTHARRRARTTRRWR